MCTAGLPNTNGPQRELVRTTKQAVSRPATTFRGLTRGGAIAGNGVGSLASDRLQAAMTQEAAQKDPKT